jgi:hypothetical protein
LQEMKHMPLPIKANPILSSPSLAKTSLADEPRTDPSIPPSIHVCLGATTLVCLC